MASFGSCRHCYSAWWMHKSGGLTLHREICTNSQKNTLLSLAWLYNSLSPLSVSQSQITHKTTLPQNNYSSEQFFRPASSQSVILNCDSIFSLYRLEVTHFPSSPLLFFFFESINVTLRLTWRIWENQEKKGLMTELPIEKSEMWRFLFSTPPGYNLFLWGSGGGSLWFWCIWMPDYSPT